MSNINRKEMPSTEIPQESIDICNRYFEAVAALKEKKKIRGVETLARRWGTSVFSMKWSKNHPEQKRIKVEYIYYMARDYNVSLEWLFFGTGEMFRKAKRKP